MPAPPDSPPVQDWQHANQAVLTARLLVLKQRLANYADGRTPAASPPDAAWPHDAAHPSALDRLAEAFALSPFERDTLLLCAGMELDDDLAELCARCHGDLSRPYPTFSLALAVLPGAHWSAVTPEAPLRRWRLVEAGPSQILTRAPLRIDERVLHFLAGIPQFDERLAILLDPLRPLPPASLVPSQAALAGQLAQTWLEASQDGAPAASIAQLNGAASDCLPVAAAAASLLGWSAAILPAERLPTAPADLDSLLRLWEREAVLSGAGVLVIDSDDEIAADSEQGRTRSAAIARLLDRATGPVLLREREPRRLSNRQSVMLEVGHPTTAEQLAIWHSGLGDREGGHQPGIAAAAAQFSLTVPAIRAVAAEVLATEAGSPPAETATLVWDACRRRLRGALDGLAQRTESDLHWDDLVLPDAQTDTLRALAAQLRQRAKVHETWGFAAKSRRGLGISALFHGPSGTGKTMAAEVLANELRLDLYHIDLSRIVSKYIGETEKNLRRVFDAAEENGAILLFDEADSLFGSRSEVKDSHDRYANIEVSYLLQRMEAYRGLAILTTNMRGALDQAFLRRIRFAVPFPFPDATRRAAIWTRAFPAGVPTSGLDTARLARLRLAGGNIRTVALNAAFLAADAGEAVGMAHLRTAAMAEYAKLERRLTEAENEAWA